MQRYQQVVRAESGEPFPQDPSRQLRRRSRPCSARGTAARAVAYRTREHIPHDLGTAVNVQAMVFGNRDDNSGHRRGLHPRPRHRRARRPTATSCVNAQGEDVVAGIRQTVPLSALADRFPGDPRELLDIFARLERHYRDMLDTEFTIEQGKLWMLQTRVGKRTGRAALRMAVEMTTDPEIRLTPRRGRHPGHARAPRPAAAPPARSGEHERSGRPRASPPRRAPASGGPTSTPTTSSPPSTGASRRCWCAPRPRPTTSHGMQAAEAVLTSHGGLVSHAAVVARGWGIPAVVGAGSIDRRAPPLHRRRRHGPRGRVDLGRRHVGRGDARSARRWPPPSRRPSSRSILGWADDIRRGRIGVRANADNGPDAARAREYGAEGIGLCRTEHMFLGDRLPLVQRMILADTPDEEAAALAELLELQRGDFEEILEAMDGLPVTVRLLDPPLHEFLPDIEELIAREARGELDEAVARAVHRGPHVAGAEPDARHPRRATRHRQGEPLQDAGAGPRRGRAAGGSQRRAARTSRS